METTMRAVVHRQYGDPDVLALEEIPRPVPGEDEVLIRVHAAGVSIGDHHVVTGKPYLVRLSPFGGIPRPKNLVPGMAMAGRIEALGSKVTTFRIGDDVFGEADTGAFAEYAVVPVNRLALKPKNLSFEEAAAVPWAQSALQGLRDSGALQAGQHVLINGASGGVGTWAVQIAKAMGATVTAVCSTRNVETLRALGADHVIDYRTHDFVTGGPRYDVMFDLIGNRSLAECRSVLEKNGVYVACAGGESDWVGPIPRLIAGLLSFLFSSRRFKAFFATPNRADLESLKALVEADKAKPVIERRFSLSEAAAALAHVGGGGSRGQTVLHIA